MLIIGRFSVFLLSLFLAFATTAAFAQVDVERLAKRLEKLEAERSLRNIESMAGYSAFTTAQRQFGGEGLAQRRVVELSE